MQYMLYKQFPKPKKIGFGRLTVDRNGGGYFFSDKDSQSILLADLTRVRLECAATDGIRISGMESSVGFTHSGDKKFTYQEWQLNYEEET